MGLDKKRVWVYAIKASGKRLDSDARFAPEANGSRRCGRATADGVSGQRCLVIGLSPPCRRAVIGYATRRIGPIKVEIILVNDAQLAPGLPIMAGTGVLILLQD